LKDEVNQKAAALKAKLDTADTDELKRDTQALMQVLQQMGAAMYQSPPGAAGDGATGDNGQTSGGEDEDVVEGEFKTN
jgi:hypothetical protein